MNAQCKHCTLQPAPAEPAPHQQQSRTRAEPTPCLHRPCSSTRSPAEPTPPPATPTTKRRGRAQPPPPVSRLNPPPYPCSLTTPTPPSPGIFTRGTRTRGTRYRSHFITATDDPLHHLFSPHPEPVSWSLHHTPCAHRLTPPVDCPAARHQHWSPRA